MSQSRKPRKKPMRWRPTPVGAQTIQSPAFSRWVHEKVEAFGKLGLIDRGERVYVTLMMLTWVITGHRFKNDLPTHEEIGALSRVVDEHFMESNDLGWKYFGDWYLGPKPVDPKKNNIPGNWLN
jgi:hypothetical protein